MNLAPVQLSELEAHREAARERETCDDSGKKCSSCHVHAQAEGLDRLMSGVRTIDVATCVFIKGISDDLR